MSKERFVKWLKHFLAQTKSIKVDPVLLICDGHASHKSTDTLTYAKEIDIYMPVYGPLKTFFHQEIS